mmetsp:Transcript_14802/g.43510  ORF Transcript_14802/g.43510 Transcript_14802/m.43510 type:complete len:261 (+) Transcript_14802:575-1357(+)
MRAGAHDARRALLVAEGGAVNTVAAHVHGVIVEVGGAVGDDLERLRGAHGGNHCVCRGDGGNDVFNHALRLHERHARDTEGGRALRGLVVHPELVLGVVGVGLGRVGEFLAVLDEVGVHDAVRRVAGRLSDGAQGHGHLRREEVERALKARGHAGEDDACVALEALGAPVDHGNHRGQVGLHGAVGRAIVVDEGAGHGVHPAPCFNRVKAKDDELELAVKFRVLVLDLAKVGGDRHALDATHDEFRGNLRLRPSDIVLAE